MTTETIEQASELVDRAEINAGGVLVEYSRTEAALAELRSKYAGAKFDLTTTAGDKAARAARLELVTLRAGLEKKRKELKAPAVEFGKKIDDEAKRITGEIVALEDPIDAQIKADEKRREEERLQRERIEADRVAAIKTRIDAIRSCVVRANAPDMTSERIQRGIDQVEAIVIDKASFAEFEEEAAQAKSTTLAAMLNLRDTAKAREDEAARLEAQRIENERIAAEQRAAAEALAAQQRALAEQAAAIAAQQKALDDAKAEAAARAEQMARLEREREAEEKAQREQAESRAAERATVIEQGRGIVNDIIAAEVLRDASSGPVDPMQDEAEKLVVEHGRASISLVQRYLRIGYNHAAKLIEAMEAKGLVTPMDSDGVRRVVGHLSVAECVAATPAPSVRPIHPAAQSLRNEQPTLTLGAMKDRLGFALTADFLAELGFEATPAKAARLYRESDWPAICQAISTHVLAVAAQQVAEAA